MTTPATKVCPACKSITRRTGCYNAWHRGAVVHLQREPVGTPGAACSAACSAQIDEPPSQLAVDRAFVTCQACVDSGLRLRMKIWTDPATHKRYLMAASFMRDVVNGRPVGGAMIAYAMSDEDTRMIQLTIDEWNALPFHYFVEDGAAPRPEPRDLDDIAMRLS